MSALIEPEVLAKSKEFLLEDRTDLGYAVVDSQFRSANWGSVRVSDNTRKKLQPINALRLRDGEPDALLAPPRPSTYRRLTGKPPSELPIAVIEAKGDTGSPSRNATRLAITQAHRHLGEVNVGYAAAPRDLITEQDRVLARELNIGLLAVTVEDVELLETPRLVGSGVSQSTETIRFHAQLGNTAVENLTKNHPKNAIGYALAVEADGETDRVFRENVIESVDDARRDAGSLGLVTRAAAGMELTRLGKESVRTISYHHGGVQSALEVIDGQTGSRSRFIDSCPVMGVVARQALLSYPPTQVLIDTIGDLMIGGLERPTLEQVAKTIARNHPEFALDLFVSSQDRERVLTDSRDTEVSIEAFEDGRIYSTHTTFQYKAMLYHAGLLTKRGSDTKSKISPDESEWTLETLLNA